MHKDKVYIEIRDPADVTEFVIDEAYEAAYGFFASMGYSVDWESVIDRLESTPRQAGTYWDFGTQEDSPAIKKLKREVRKRIRES